MSSLTADLQSTIPSADEAALIITCLRGLPLVVPDNTDWQTLLDLAEQHGVLPLVYRSLLEMHSGMPRFFTAAALKRRESAERFAAELEGLLRHFANRGIEVLPMKGPALGLALYEDLALRPCDDLDLLVRREDYQRAHALLSDLGFTAGSSDDHNCRFLRDELPVDLHFELAAPRYFPFDLDEVWSRSRRGDFRGKPIRVMSGDDLVLYLCSHGLQHGYSRLIWILDVAGALRELRHPGYKELMRRAQRQGFEPWLLIGCEVVRAMFPEQLPQAMDVLIAESPQAAKRARSAAATLFAEDAEDTGNNHLAFYTGYLQAQTSAIKRWRYRLRYFAPTAEDYRWAERHGINRGLVPVLRPFRLLRKYGPSRVWRIIFPSK
jgi:hypothetical protein